MLMEKYESDPRDGEPAVTTDGKQPWVCLGQVGVWMGRGRGLDRKDEKMHELNGHGRFRHFRPDQCEAPRPHFGEQVKAGTESLEPQNIGPPDETISIKSEGTTVQSGDSQVAE